MSRASGIAGAALTAVAATLASAQYADTIWHGGTIRPAAGDGAIVEAVAVRKGRIVAVGDLAKLQKRERGDRTVMVDLAGKTMLPGWIDVHGRPWAVGLRSEAADLAVRSIAGLQDALRAAASADGGWVIGTGYEETALEERRHPTRAELDAVSAERAVLAIHRSGLIVAANGKALELAGIGASTGDPVGGTIRRDPRTGEPDGFLAGAAAQSMLDTMIRHAGEGRALRWIEAGTARYAAAGFATAVEARLPASLIPMYVRAAKERRLAIDVVGYPDVAALGGAAAGIGRPYGAGTAGNFRLGGVELALDGRAATGTARLTAPYAAPPPGRENDYLGESWMFDDEVLDIVSRVWGDGWDLLVHAAGDGAIDQLLRAVRTASNALPIKGRRIVVVHAEVARDEQFEAMEKLYLVPSFCPALAAAQDAETWDVALGRTRAGNLAPVGWARARRLRFSLHGDAPEGELDGMRIVEAAVRRTSPDGVVFGETHRISAEAALRALTESAAAQIGEADSKGVIAVGYPADFTILSGDQVVAAPEDLAAIRVVATVKHGRTVTPPDN